MPKETFLHKELSGDEDQGLAMDKSYMNAPDNQYKIPPGVRTLDQWGQQVFPSGKNQGKSFYQVYKEDSGYLGQVKNRKAVSPWMRSFSII